MNTYMITVKDCDKGFIMNAEYYEIQDGFVRLYKKANAHTLEEFAAFSVDCVRHIVLQEQS